MGRSLVRLSHPFRCQSRPSDPLAHERHSLERIVDAKHHVQVHPAPALSRRSGCWRRSQHLLLWRRGAEKVAYFSLAGHQHAHCVYQGLLTHLLYLIVVNDLKFYKSIGHEGGRKESIHAAVHGVGLEHGVVFQFEVVFAAEVGHLNNVFFGEETAS